jgi:hypothetical protein
MTRIPEGLRRRLERAATREGRSMNAEIVHRLEQSFQMPELAAALAEAVRTAAYAAGVGVGEMAVEKLAQVERHLARIAEEKEEDSK